MSAEIYKRFRPKKLSSVIGQETAVQSLEKLLANNFPHAVLITGPSGVGKTTIARILKDRLGCSDMDFMERNCADFRSIDDVREIRRRNELMPIGGRCRIWLIDECHKLTNDAQNAFLKMLEDTPKHVYFFLCTTDPQKVIKTIHTRCTQIKLNALKEETLVGIVQGIIKKANLAVDEAVVEEICKVAEGSARKALVLLDQVANIETEADQLKAIYSTDFNRDDTIKLARELMFGQNGWNAVAKILRDLAEQEAEGIRYAVLGYARACLVGSKDGKPPNLKVAPRAYTVIDIFSRNFYDSKHAGLAAACWEAYNQQT